MTEALEGKQIGPYRIVRQVGAGGMATVYLAEDTTSGRPVAFKLIRADMAVPDMAAMLRARFMREVRLLQRLEHPNIVRIFNAGEYDGQPYLVMEYLPGGSLRDRIRPVMNYRQAAAYLLPITEALIFAHAQGVLHRDIKPANILFDAEGRPRLTDFGIAKDFDAQEMTALTGTGVGIGTPDYMSPEQSLGQPTDGRADIYSLGVVLYELVSGKKPYSGTTPAAVLIQHINEPLLDPRTYSPDIPEAVVRVLEKAMAKNPANRYPDVAAFANVLQRLADGDLQWALALTGMPGGLRAEVTLTPTAPPTLPPAAPPLMDRYAVPPPLPYQPISNHLPMAEPPKKTGPPPWLWWLIGLGGLAALLFLGFVLSNFGLFPNLARNTGGTQTLEALVTQLSAEQTAALSGTPGAQVCDRFAFVSDVTLPDDVEVPAGSVQVKTWRIRNAGTCAWSTDYVMTQVNNTGLGAPTLQPLPGAVQPGETVDISIELTMPAEPGRYQADYRLRNTAGILFGSGADGQGTIYVRVQVVPGAPPTPTLGAETPTPPVNPTATLEPTQTSIPPTPTPGLVFSTPAAPVSERPAVTGFLAYAEGGTGSWRITIGDVRAWMLASLPGIPADSGVPAWSPDGRSLLFRSSAAGSWQVYRINIDGSSLGQLTSQGNNYEAAWSPDGSRIVFVSERDGDKEIYIMNADGSAQSRLTDHAGWDDDPSWSPDGQWIVFESRRDDRMDIYRMRADGSELVRLTSTGDMNGTPAWSPDGQWIAFERRQDTSTHIWVMDVNGGAQRQVTTEGTENLRAAWSPDSQYLAFTSNQGGQYAIWIMPASGASRAIPFSPGGGFDAAWTWP